MIQIVPSGKGVIPNRWYNPRAATKVKARSSVILESTVHPVTLGYRIKSGGKKERIFNPFCWISLLTPKFRGFFNTMFTGIITYLGEVVNKSENKLIIKTDRNLINKLSKGTSIAVDGICLTVVDLIEDSFSIDFMPETEEKTNIKYLQIGNMVNLELPATAKSFLSGHIVQGHIDGAAKLKTITQEDNSYILKFSIPKDLSKYIVQKGSIAVNGISLTVIDVGDNFFTVGIIPHTWVKTMLQTIKLGDYVNIEVDILAKYLEKLIQI